MRKPDEDLSVIRIDPRPPGGLKGIAAAVAARHGLQASDLLSLSRRREIVRVRWEYMSEARKVTWADGTPRYSLPQIAQSLGGMDHTTVLHGLRQYAKISRSQANIKTVNHCSMPIEAVIRSTVSCDS